MQSLSLHTQDGPRRTLDPTEEVERLEALIGERRRELAELQEEMRAFKARYTATVGGALSELAEIERAIRKAEARMLGHEEIEDEEDAHAGESAPLDETSGQAFPVKKALRKLFWTVAKMFHPDHAANELERERRHTVMAEASRAYTEGDVESLHTLLGDDQLQSLCAVMGDHGDERDAGARLPGLEIELRTVEFGIKRIKQDGLYRTKMAVDAEALEGRDALAQMAESLQRQIVKARHRLAHLS